MVNKTFKSILTLTVGSLDLDGVMLECVKCGQVNSKCCVGFGMWD